MAHARIAALGAAVAALVVIAALPSVRSHHSVQEHTTVVRAAVSATTPGHGHNVSAYRDGILGSSTTCSYRTTTIACNDPALGWWNSTDSCYWNLISPQPPAGSPLWLGNLPADGSLYNRTCETDGGLGIGVLGNSVAFSSDPPPGYKGIAGTVAQLLALQAIVSLGILGPIVGTAPAAGGHGLVGLPVWMWQTPTLLTWGPIGLGLGLGPLGVGVNALGAKVDWYMGDGSDVVCGIGTAYAKADGRTTSPTCGYVYPAPSSTQPGGVYTVTAAATWNVTWQVGLVSGSLTIVRATTIPLTIDELQVVNQ